MTILLAEAAGPADPVGAALAALVEAAMASEEAITPAALGGMVAYQIELLGEAGGLMSWIRSHYTGVDKKAAAEFERELAEGIRGSYHRRQMLDTVNRMLDRARDAMDSGPVGHVLGDALPVGIPAFVFGLPTLTVAAAASGAARAVGVGRNKRNGDLKKYIETLKVIRDKIKAAPLRNGG
jgi:hypothetical protein